VRHTYGAGMWWAESNQGASRGTWWGETAADTMQCAECFHCCAGRPSRTSLTKCWADWKGWRPGDSTMKISYDPEVECAVYPLIEGEYECRTLRLTRRLPWNIGPEEVLVGIEILDAKQVLGKGELPAVVLEKREPFESRIDLPGPPTDCAYRNSRSKITFSL